MAGSWSGITVRSRISVIERELKFFKYHENIRIRISVIERELKFFKYHENIRIRISVIEKEFEFPLLNTMRTLCGYI
jgi:hypothetical protein